MKKIFCLLLILIVVVGAMIVPASAYTSYGYAFDIYNAEYAYCSYDGRYVYMETNGAYITVSYYDVVTEGSNAIKDPNYSLTPLITNSYSDLLSKYALPFVTHTLNGFLMIVDTVYFDDEDGFRRECSKIVYDDYHYLFIVPNTYSVDYTLHFTYRVMQVDEGNPTTEFCLLLSPEDDYFEDFAPSDVREFMELNFSNGYNHGYSDGFQDGYDDGYFTLEEEYNTSFYVLVYNALADLIFDGDVANNYMDLVLTLLSVLLLCLIIAVPILVIVFFIKAVLLR